MKHRKELLVAVCVLMILGRTALPLIQYWPVLNDTEFDNAKVRAREVWLENSQRIEDYPFAVVTRAQAVQWYLSMIDLLDKQPLRETCSFTDIQSLDSQLQDEIIRSCTLNIFLWDWGAFNPDRFMTKATALVALMRSLRPALEYPMQDLYRTPYANDAYTLWITKRPSNEYLEYPITQYELLLLLYRGYRLCEDQKWACE